MLKARFGTLFVMLKIHRDGLHGASFKYRIDQHRIERRLDPPRLNIGSGEAQLGPKMGQHGPKMAPLGRRWSPSGPQLRRKIVKHASALLIFSGMSPNIVFPTVFAWLVAPSGAQDEPRWAPSEPKMAQESAKMEPRGPSWSQDEPNMTPRWSKMGRPRPT